METRLARPQVTLTLTLTLTLILTLSITLTLSLTLTLTLGEGRQLARREFNWESSKEVVQPYP